MSGIEHSDDRFDVRGRLNVFEKKCHEAGLKDHASAYGGLQGIT